MIKKRIISLLLAMLLALSAAPTALAEEAGVRETDFFTKQPHSSLQYEEMSYEHLELEPFLEETNAIRALLKEPSNEEAVRRRYGALSDRMDLAVTMLTLAMIRSYQDTGDQALAEEVTYATLLCTDMQDAYLLLLQDVLVSPCGGFLREQFSDEEVTAFLEYESLSDTERDLVSREAELTQTVESQMKVIIEQEYAAYIVDKAEELGILCQAEVTCSNDENGVPCPWEVTTRGVWTEEKRAAVGRLLEGDLGIPPQRQYFEEELP